MKIINIRAGFATNSSSSHSVLFCDPEALKNVEDYLCDRDGRFGWEYFVAKSKKEKFRYLLAFSDSVDREIYSKKYSGDFWNHEEDAGDLGDYSVDHQSCDNLKYSSFDEAVKKYVLDDQVVIVGGNDNSDNDGESNMYDQACYAALYRM